MLRYLNKCVAVLGLLLSLTRVNAETKSEACSLVPFRAGEQSSEQDPASKTAQQAEEAKRLVEAAAAGDLNAIVRVGILYETGNGLPQDFVKAREQYELAIAGGLPEGHFHFALCLLEGWGGPIDKAGFAKEIRSAAQAGYVPAQRLLASLCLTGFAMPKNEAEGLRWLETASASDDVISQVKLGQEIEDITRRVTLREDLSRAQNWYKLSAEKDYHVAMRALCRSILEGPAKDRNWTLATHWLELAIEGGDSEAPYTRALIEVLHPDSPQRDEAKALSFLKIAMNRGHIAAEHVLQLIDGGSGMKSAMMTVLETPTPELYVRLNKRQGNADAGQGDKLPEPIFMTQPSYPPSLHLLDVQGEAVIAFIVEKDGTTSHSQSISSTHPFFGEAACKAVSRWRFKPGTKEGHPVRFRMQVPIGFIISNEMIMGVDEIISDAKALARKRPQIAKADIKDLTMGIPVGGIPQIIMSDMSPPGNDTYCTILFTVEPDGRVSRGYILARSLGVDDAATWAKVEATRFKPRVVDGKPELTNCVIILGAVEKLYPLLGLKRGK